MNKFKVSIITVCYNAENTIERCILSVAAQLYSNIEYIVVDGASGDSTLTIINGNKKSIDVIVSEPDKGIYDAMNKGIALASGDIIGMLNADDTFTDNNAVTEIVAAFMSKEVDVVYADLNYLKQSGRVFRKWISGAYGHGLFEKGWMPPHPTFYCKRHLFTDFGNYRLDFGTAADYELMLRIIHTQKTRVFYINKVLVNMYIGGVSNNSYSGRIKVLFLDWKAMRINGLHYPFIALLLKRLRKIEQFFNF